MSAADMLNDSRVSINVAAMLVLTLMENGSVACQVVLMPSLKEIYGYCSGGPRE